MANIWRTGSWRNAWLRWDMLLKFRSTIPSLGNGMSYMLLRVEILLFERSNNSKEGDTCLASLETILRLDLSIISDFKSTSGFRLMFSHVPLQLFRPKDSNVPPIALNSGAWCRLCHTMNICRSSGSPSNASGSICFSELDRIYNHLKKTIVHVCYRIGNVVSIPGISQNIHLRSSSSVVNRPLVSASRRRCYRCETFPIGQDLAMLINNVFNTPSWVMCLYVIHSTLILCFKYIQSAMYDKTPLKR